MRVLIAIGCLTLMIGVAAQQPPADSAADVRPGPGLEVKLWASEPMLTNPTNMAIDERGRVWVLEAVNYRRALRSQPDVRETGDRIVILEDTDQDGVANRTTVFDEGPHLRAPLGIAVLGNKVYVSQSPDLTVYTKDAEDRIVSKEVLLTGFGGVDHDHGLHAIVFGPDGRFYFNHGNTGMSVTDRSGRTVQSSSYLNEPLNRPDAGYFQGVSLRMNQNGTNLEVLGQNFRNPYELTVDSFGNVFQTDNDDDGNAWTRLSYVIEGGNFGYYGPLHRAWNADRGGHFHNELPGVVPNVLRLGPGSPCGLLIYEGTLLPQRYRGQLMHAEAGKRIVGGYPLTDDGAGFSARIEELAFGGADTWFRPSDVTVAPDGAVFVADWYDPGVGGHNTGDAGGARGRIYRIAPPGNRPQVPALDLQSDAGLTAALRSPNQAVQYLAHTEVVRRGADAVPLLQRLWQQDEPILKARTLWLLGGKDDVGPAAIAEALRDSDPRFRILGLRVARLYGGDVLALATPLLRDPSAQVRREIAILLRDTDPSRMQPPYLMSSPQVTPSAAWLDAMLALIDQYDGQDRWYLEALAIAARGREDAIFARLKETADARPADITSQLVWVMRPRTALVDLVAMLEGADWPVAARLAAADTIGAMEWPEATRAIESVILAPDTAPAVLERAFGIYARQLYSLWPDARESDRLAAVVRRAFAEPSSQSAAVDLVSRLADRQFLPDVVALMRDAGATPEARAAAIALVATTADPQYLTDVRHAASSDVVPVAVAAVRAAGALAAPDAHVWAQEILLGTAPNEVRVEALRLMATSPAGLNALLDLGESGRLPPEWRALASSLTNNAGPGRGRGRGGFAPPPAVGGAQAPPAGRATGPGPEYVAIRERAARVLPLASTTAGPLPGIAALERNYRGNAEAGRQVFQVDGACAACHSLGGARTVGPDLSAIGLKYGKQAMLDHIVRPSDAIGHEYVTTTFELRSGETVSGIVTDNAADRVVVRVGETEQRQLNPADIASRRRSSVSLMPEGLLDALTLQQISDLLEFLSTQTGQTTPNPHLVVYQGDTGPGAGKHIVFIAGDHEYRSEETLPALARILARHYGFKTSVFITTDPQTGFIDPGSSHIAGLEALKTADLLVIYTRFQEFPDAEMQHIIDYVDRGGPIVGFRTATHAFQIRRPGSPFAKYTWNNKDPEYTGGFGRQVLGETWVSHYGTNHKQSSQLVIDPAQAAHPILRGVKGMWAESGGYTAYPIEGSVVLARGRILDGMTPDSPPATDKEELPVAWTRAYRSASGRDARVFTTTHGASEDLRNEGFRRMSVNAILWAAGLEDAIRPDNDVSLVGPYNPTRYAFDGFVQGVRPSDLAGWDTPIPRTPGKP